MSTLTQSSRPKSRIAEFILAYSSIYKTVYLASKNGHPSWPSYEPHKDFLIRTFPVVSGLRSASDRDLTLGHLSRGELANDSLILAAKFTKHQFHLASDPCLSSIGSSQK